jgi:NADH:ubiquinone oxidoreductase subunit F (NADH-binding)
MNTPTLLAGPDPRAGAESLAEHERRLGPLPPAGQLVDTLERSGLLGRGGASFPVGVKWRSVASRSSGTPVVVANGAEGEPLSRKDQTLMWSRPHLVLDGALLAAEATGADRVVLYVGEDHGGAAGAIARAVGERPPAQRRRIAMVAAPARYVAGEETAAVHFVNEGVAAPTATPPRPYERGVDGRPTLVQNVESLAHAALIARWGDRWFRSLGHDGAAGTVLLTAGGAVRQPGVLELPAGSTIGEALDAAGGEPAAPRAVLLGGYFGAWLDVREAWPLRLDPLALRSAGGALGCGVVWVLPATASPVEETARIMGHLARESAAQCGPCFFGLRALAETCGRLAARQPRAGDLERLGRWSVEVRGRGACRHPDGAAGFLQSALRVFQHEFAVAARAGDRQRRAA